MFDQPNDQPNRNAGDRKEYVPTEEVKVCSALVNPNAKVADRTDDAVVRRRDSISGPILI
jgi:hypothetical protein